MEINQDFAHVDLKGFASELDELKAETVAQLGRSDYQHLRKIERWGRLCTLVGYGTAWLLPNPLSAYLISQGNLTRWAMISHHICHRGYDRIEGIPKRYHSSHFAKGWRRFLDWPDWMLPEGWNIEHNVLHHFHTGEYLDPDVFERVVQIVRKLRAPIWIKYLLLLPYFCSWKLTYYAPNTLWIWQKSQQRKKRGKESNQTWEEVFKEEPTESYHGVKVISPTTKTGLDFWRLCVLPYGLYRFVLLPLLFFPLGLWAILCVLLNTLLAEVFTNIHSFLIIIPNHSGEDLYRFDEPIKNKEEFYFRQVVGSANYTCGGDLKDFLQGWLNYQIEHHLWPDLPMSTYQKLQPKVEAICQKYGVPYVKESLWKRIKKMFRLMVGQASMKNLHQHPIV